jgi:hypothetical protein
MTHSEVHVLARYKSLIRLQQPEDQMIVILKCCRGPRLFYYKTYPGYTGGTPSKRPSAINNIKCMY